MILPTTTQSYPADAGEFLEIIATGLAEPFELTVYICDENTYPLLQEALRSGSDELHFPHLIKCRIVPPTNGVAYELPHASRWYVYIPSLPDGISVDVHVRDAHAYDDVEEVAATDDIAAGWGKPTVPSLENHPIARLLYPPCKAAVEYYVAQSENPAASHFHFRVDTPNDFVMGDIAGMVTRSEDVPGAFIVELQYEEIDGSAAGGFFLIAL